jgi:hypothetical protein
MEEFSWRSEVINEPRGDRRVESVFGPEALRKIEVRIWIDFRCSISGDLWPVCRSSDTSLTTGTLLPEILRVLFLLLALLFSHVIPRSHWFMEMNSRIRKTLDRMGHREGLFCGVLFRQRHVPSHCCAVAWAGDFSFESVSSFESGSRVDRNCELERVGEDGAGQKTHILGVSSAVIFHLSSFILWRLAIVWAGIVPQEPVLMLFSSVVSQNGGIHHCFSRNL